MATSSRAHSESRYFLATLGGIVLGQLAGDKSVTLARVFRWILDKPPNEHTIAEIALGLILIVAGGLIPALGWLTMRLGLVTKREVMLSIAAAMVALTFAVIEYSLPAVRPGGNVNLQPLYFLGWIALLWFAPVVLLTKPAEYAEWSWRLITVAAPAAILGFLAGLVVDYGVRFLGWAILPDGNLLWRDAGEFWIARPAGINAVASSFIVVAFPSIWWRDIKWSTGTQWRHVLIVTIVVAVYAGLFGWGFHDEGHEVRRFLGFGLMPVGGISAMGLVIVMRRGTIRRLSTTNSAVSDRRFWCLLSICFAVCLSLVAFIGLAPLQGSGGARLLVLMTAHGVNGLILGGVLWATAWYSYRSMPA